MKRLLDLALAVAASLLLAPVLLAVALAVKLDSGGAVLFRQKRLGKGGIPFTLFKFQTMVQSAPVIYNPDGSCFVSSNDPRVTRVGRWLREYSLDELPQLWNVLRGEMSVVGPRPDVVSALQNYDEVFRVKLQVKPGLTSLPAVRGRNSLPWRKRAELDRYYVEHQSLSLDLKILLLTVPTVLGRAGIYTPTVAPVENAKTEEQEESARCAS